MGYEVNKEELKQRLTAEQYKVTQEQGTERAFSGKYHDSKADGVYKCIVCDEPLFLSDTKFDSRTGWPSFFQPVSEDAVEEQADRSHFMVRKEVHCKNCGAHLGHIFDDAPRTPTGMRYCINSASLNLQPTSPDTAD
jgi:peptide-methionine (R)-S-oxide reductase